MRRRRPTSLMGGAQARTIVRRSATLQTVPRTACGSTIIDPALPSLLRLPSGHRPRLCATRGGGGPPFHHRENSPVLALVPRLLCASISWRSSRGTGVSPSRSGPALIPLRPARRTA